VDEGRLEFYDLEAVAEVERQRCTLGIRTSDNRIDPQPLEQAEVLLVETPKLVATLRAYGDSLAAIADAADRDALQSSLGEAKLAINGLAARVDELTGSEDQALAVRVGLVSDLVGPALVASLDYRRYKALQRVTSAANPAIQQAAMLLSQVSMPMVALELQHAGRDFLKTVADTNDRPRNQAWHDAYAKARKARETYLDLFSTSPTPVFKAMADAHADLTEALQDPKRHYDALQESLREFVAKADAAYETFTQ
jgi:hypothetical protein